MFFSSKYSCAKLDCSYSAPPTHKPPTHFPNEPCEREELLFRSKCIFVHIQSTRNCVSEAQFMYILDSKIAEHRQDYLEHCWKTSIHYTVHICVFSQWTLWHTFTRIYARTLCEREKRISQWFMCIDVHKLRIVSSRWRDIRLLNRIYFPCIYAVSESLIFHIDVSCTLRLRKHVSTIVCWMNYFGWNVSSLLARRTELQNHNRHRARTWMHGVSGDVHE